MISFHKNSIILKYSIKGKGKEKKGKIKAYFPPMDKLDDFLIKYLPNMPNMNQNKITYLRRMTQFSTIFPIRSDEYVNYQEMQKCGLISKSSNPHSVQLEAKDVKSLFYNAVKSSVLKVNMSEEGYYSFRDMVLDELEIFNNTIKETFDDTYKKEIEQFSHIKRLKLIFKSKKLADTKKNLQKTIWIMVTDSATAQSNEMAKNNFPQRALELIENFDLTKYKILIGDVVTELNSLSSSCNREVIGFLQNQEIQKNKNDVLMWIVNNTCSVESAFENMKREADYLNKEIICEYNLYFYRKHRKKMNRPERRLFQLCYFRRELFQYRIPVFDDFLKSFWASNPQLIFSGLIFKGLNPDFEKDNSLLLQKWTEFLLLYPEAKSNQNLFNLMRNEKKAKDLINTDFSGDDAQILHAIADGYEIDTVLAEFGCTKDYCLELVERFRKNAEHKEKSDFKD